MRELSIESPESRESSASVCMARDAEVVPRAHDKAKQTHSRPALKDPYKIHQSFHIPLTLDIPIIALLQLVALPPHPVKLAFAA